MPLSESGEEEPNQELVRRDDFLANPSDPESIPSAAASPEIRFAGSRLDAKWIRLRAALQRLISRTSTAVPPVTDVDNIADGSTNPIPTIDASPLVIRRPYEGPAADDAHRSGQTTVRIAVKAMETLEVAVEFITSRVSLIRAFVYLVVVAAALGAVALVKYFLPDVPDPVLILVVGGSVFGIGLWFVDKTHDRENGKHHDRENDKHHDRENDKHHDRANDKHHRD